MKQLQRFFPILEWGKSYSLNAFRGDVVAGLTVGVILVPQGMAYAMLAGLPPVYGLYAAFFPQMVYAFMGTSRHLAVGPVALDSLLVASGLGALSLADPSQYLTLAIFLAFYVGLLQVILGCLRLGFLINYLSKPVVSGFTSAAAILIGLSQLGPVLGMALPQGLTFQDLFSHLPTLNLSYHKPTFLVGVTGIFFLLVLKRYLPKFPAALFMVLVATAIAAVFGWEERGIAVVGFIPEGLPSPQIPVVRVSQLYAITPLAITLALIAFMEALSVAKVMEEKENDSSLQPNQELIALGMANMLGSFFRAYPTSGGFSRTAVNYQSGAKSGFAGLISAGVVGLTLVFFTDYFYDLPKAALGSIIVVAVIQLMDVKYPKELWQKSRDEFYILLFTFFTTLFLGIKYGILLGVFISLGYIVYRNSQPHIAVLGRIKGTSHFKNVSRFSKDVITYPNVLMLRFDGPLFFGNQRYFKAKIQELITMQAQPVRHLIIDAGPIHYIDATAFHMLRGWIADLKQENTSVLWTQPIGPIRDRFCEYDLIEEQDKQTFFSSLDAAIKYLHGEAMSVHEKKISNQVNC
jgi:SulP family sulfate permease